MRIISQRVAPSASTASRWLYGTAVITSRVSDEMIGRIMIARITPAASMPMPKLGPEKSVVHPSVFASTGFTCSRSSGTSTNTAHNPYTTLGIAASSSVMKASGERSQRGHISVRKIARPTASGTAMTSATSEETSVP